MIEYFPTNYVWNLSVNIALATGANHGEVDEVCRQLVEASQRTDDSGSEAFFRAWRNLGDRLVALAEQDLAVGRTLSAGTKLGRAAIYYMTGERMTHPTYTPRKEVYEKACAASPGTWNWRGRTAGASRFPIAVRRSPACSSPGTATRQVCGRAWCSPTGLTASRR
ncbi:hypothetical protein P4209_22650 [Pseudomonas aeruginosa]|nr:hypothetical protein [Pseudomonas aeruginosa]